MKSIIISNSKRLSILCLALILLAFTSCKKFEGTPKNDDLFFIQNKGAEMPVWVRGNKTSDVFIILNHGGPGSSAVFETHLEAQPGDGNLDSESPLKILEDTYNMVYWDQRFSGNAQGNANPDEATPSDFGDDLNLLIETLKKRHKVSKLIVIGQSWGNSVATNYMTVGDDWEERQNKIDGYINYKGNVSFDMPYQFVKSRLKDSIQKKIDVNDEHVDYWKDSKSFIDSHETLIDAEDAMQYFGIVYNAMDAMVSTGERVGTSVDYTFSSPHNGWYHYANINNTMGSKFMENLVTDNSLEESTHRINKPTLILYGRKDLVAPFEVGEWFLNNISTPDSQKKLVILENSRHGAEGDDIDIFQREVIDFIESIE